MKCIKCGSTEKYYAKGLCNLCYQKELYLIKKTRPQFLETKKKDSRKTYFKYKEKILARQRERRLANPKLFSERVKLAMHKRRDYLKEFGIDINEGFLFNGNKQIAYFRDNYSCQDCGITNSESIKQFGRQLHIHHIDGNGSNKASKKEKNNDISNLVTLCTVCHTKEHQRIRHGKTPRTLSDFIR
jgi:5-methylcytosine-specific restriction endonuclease McrA